MKSKLVLIAALLLSACGPTIADPRINVPPPPAPLMEAPRQMGTIPQ